MFALLVYMYSVLKACNGTLDWILCYYIISAFFPIILYLSLLLEKIKTISEFGDSKHIATVGEIAPVFLLSYQFIVSASLSIIGFVIGASKEIPIYWGISAIPSIFASVLVIINRKQLVTTSYIFTTSKNPKVNSIVSFLFFGSICFPLISAKKQLMFGFSTEFEFTISLILAIELLYIVVRKIRIRSYQINYDEIIDDYLRYDKNKESIIKKIEHKSLGFRPVEKLQREYDDLVEISKIIPGIEDQVNKIVEDATNKGITVNDIEQLSNILNQTDEYTDKGSHLLARCKEILDLKTPSVDEDFRAMIMSLQDLPDIKTTIVSIRKINELIRVIMCRHCGGLCENMECKDRDKPMSRLYKIKHNLKKVVNSKRKK